VMLLAAVVVLSFLAFGVWVVVLIRVAQLFGRLKHEQEKTRRDLDLHAFALACQLAADNEERRKHLNLVQGMLVGHVTGTARSLERVIAPDAPRVQLRTVWPLPLRPRTRRRRQAARAAREAA